MKMPGFLLLAGALLLGGAGHAAAQVNYAKAGSSLGLYYPNRSAFYLQDSDGSGAIDVVSITGVLGSALPFAGDWTGTGYDAVGLYDRTTSTFYLRNNILASGPADTTVVFGSANTTYIPVAGDWTGKGYKSIGYYNPATATFYLRNSNTAGSPDLTLPMLNSSGTAPPTNITPLVGDWVGDGITRVGYYDPASGTFNARMTNGTTVAAQKCAAPVYFGAQNTTAIGLVGKWLPTATKFGIGTYTSSNNLVYEKDDFSQSNNGYADRQEVLAPQGQEAATLPEPVVGKWLPSRALTTGQNTSPTSPSWLKNQIIYEMRIETFTDSTAAGSQAETFAGATAQLPYLASLGVTGVILDPIEANGQTGDIRANNAYWNYQPGTLEPRLGTDADFTNFVNAAHGLGIKVMVDSVQHGLGTNSPYASGSTAFPFDYLVRDASGNLVTNVFGCYELDFTSQGLRDWWTNHVGAWVGKYGIDGFRMDLEPAIGSYPNWNQLRTQVLASTGKQIILLPELPSSPSVRAYSFDATQNDFQVDPANGLLYNPATTADAGNIVDVVKACSENYYTSSISCHDTTAYVAQGKLSRFAYGLLLSPFIPRWFMGEEFNATADFVTSGPLYESQLHLSQATTNAAFLKQVEQLVQIRKAYKNIIAPMAGATSSANITKVTSYSGPDLPPYSLWSGGSSITVLASSASATGMATLKVPISAMGVGSVPWFQVTELLSGVTSIASNAQMTSGLSYSLTQGGALALLAQSPALYDNFNYTAANLDGHAVASANGNWSVTGGAISTDGTKAKISVNGGTAGSGSAVGNFAFTPAANTIYTLSGTFLYNGPIGAGVNAWAGLGFSNVAGGGSISGNTGPWMTLSPQGVATDSPAATGYAGTAAIGSGTLAASNFSTTPSPVTLTVTWNTATGQAQYFINGALQSTWIATTALPTGNVYAFFEGFQTGNAVNLQNVTLTSLQVSPTPSIVKQPQQQFAASGQPATFTVQASGTAPLSYQWQKNGVNIAGATSASYTVPSVSSGDVANYSVLVSNDNGGVASSAAGLVIFSGSQTVTTGAPFSFSVAPSQPGTTMLVNETFNRGTSGMPVALAGATPTAESGTATGAPWNEAPGPSGSSSVTNGAQATLTSAPNGSQSDYVRIAGGYSPTTTYTMSFNIPNFTPTAGGDSWLAVGLATTGSAEGNPLAGLFIRGPGNASWLYTALNSSNQLATQFGTVSHASTLADNATTKAGTQVTITFDTSTGVTNYYLGTLTATGTPDFTYTYPTLPSSAGGLYVATEVFNNKNPAAAIFPVSLISLSITPNPSPFNYQWSFNGTPISGATSATYSGTNATASGTYSVVATNAYGSTTYGFSLTVNPPTNTDTPTMPEWGLIALGVAFVFFGARLMRQRA